MLRATVLSIVLALSAAQNAPLLCRVWCRSEPVGSAACAHQDPSTAATVAGDHNCGTPLFSIVAVADQVVRRSAPAPDERIGLAASDFQLAIPAVNSVAAVRPGQPLPRAQRPPIVTHRL